MSTAELNSKFGVTNYIEFCEDVTGFAKVVLKHKCGSSAEIYLLGATVTSFKTSKGDQLLFLSSKALFQKGKAIRGGIPICFPQFGPGELPQHGFARTSEWLIHSSKLFSESGDVSVTLILKDSEETRKVWNHSFTVEYTVSLRQVNDEERLFTHLQVTNNNADKEFSFTGALHTYFRIPSVEDVTIKGLKNLTYIDKVKKAEKFEEVSDSIKFTEELDRVYISTPPEIIIQDSSIGIGAIVKKEGFHDCIIWNPWSQKAKAMADLGEDDWKHFVCVEAGVVAASVHLNPGASWKGSQILSKL